MLHQFKPTWGAIPDCLDEALIPTTAGTSAIAGTTVAGTTVAGATVTGATVTETAGIETI